MSIHHDSVFLRKFITISPKIVISIITFYISYLYFDGTLNNTIYHDMRLLNGADCETYVNNAVDR
jgi:hypothetical protein